MADIESGDKKAAASADAHEGLGGQDMDTDIGTDDDTAIFPKGQVDPIYEAKARVLNRAACPWSQFILPPTVSLIADADQGYRHGLVSMAAVRCRGVWLGQR